MQHQSVYHSVQRKVKKDKIQRWWNLAQGNNPLSEDWKCSIEVHYLKVARVYSETDGLRRSQPCSHAMSSLRVDHWFETQVQFFSYDIVLVLFLHLTRSHGHLRECYWHGYYFFGFRFLETRSCHLQYWSFNDPYNLLSSFAIWATVCVALWRFSKPIWNTISCN